ncbi:oxidoreductase [Verrucomicrobiaceae bacterium SCGC AG-212-N21]|nr:oxidoreductase [Verrucomicrobiaceae bacterium SCGC AG-212-N21]
MESDRKLCRWGILSTAFIARKNWQAILDAGNASLVAVASRDVAKSRQFVEECQSQIAHPQVPEALGSYEALITHPGIDALYIPLPTGLRKEWVIRAANAGKHVLVEKPVGTNENDALEMTAACERNRVQFMDGVMFMHSQRLRRLRAVLDDPKRIGAIRRLALHFSFAGGEEFMRGNIRTHGALEPLGCLGDLGWYCVRFALWAMNYQLPQQVTARILSEAKQDDGLAAVPTEMNTELIFANGVSASFHCSFISENAEWAHVSGARGSAFVSDFVLPFHGSSTNFIVRNPEFLLAGCEFDMHERRTDVLIDEPSNNAPGSQEAEMFRTFSALVLEGQLDAHWPRITLRTQRVIDACLQSGRNGGRPVDLT